MLLQGDISAALSAPVWTQTWRPFLRNHFFLFTAAAIFALPPLVGLARNVWAVEQGSYGPVILTAGLWLLYHDGRRLRELATGSPVVIVLGMVPAIAAFVLGHIIGMSWLEWLGAYAALVIILYAYVGKSGVRELWFAITLLAFLVPIPFSVAAPLTRWLKTLMSTSAVELANAVGIHVAASGTMLYVDQYELLIASACSGINSIFSLLAMGLFYIHLLHRAHPAYAALLALFIVPIAIAANIGRIFIMVLVTHFFGADATDGPLHTATGMSTFFLGLFGLIALDALLRRFGRQAKLH